MSEVVKPSIRPSKAVEGGAAEFDGTIVQAFVGTNDYAGTVTPPVVGLYVLLRNDDNPEGKPRFADFISAGKSTFLIAVDANGQPAETKFETDQNGRQQAIAGGVGFGSARPDKPFAGLVKGSNLFKYLEVYLKAGYKESDMHVDGNENHFGFLLGERFHYGLGELARFEGQTGDAKKLMLPTKYIGKDSATVVASVNGQPAVGQITSSFDAKAEATAFIIEILAEQPDQTISKQSLTPLVSSKFKDPTQKSAIVKLLVSAAFLQTIEGVEFKDGKTLTLKG